MPRVTLIHVVASAIAPMDHDHPDLGIVADTFHMSIEGVCQPASRMAAEPGGAFQTEGKGDTRRVIW